MKIVKKNSSWATSSRTTRWVEMKIVEKKFERPNQLSPRRVPAARTIRSIRSMQPDVGQRHNSHLRRRGQQTGALRLMTASSNDSDSRHPDWIGLEERMRLRENKSNKTQPLVRMPIARDPAGKQRAGNTDSIRVGVGPVAARRKPRRYICAYIGAWFVHPSQLLRVRAEARSAVSFSPLSQLHAAGK